MNVAAETQSDRAAWLEARKSALGASDVPAILNLSPFTTAWEVWAEKTNRLEPWSGNASTRAGQAFERAVLDEAEYELGPLERNVRLIHSRYPVAATLDARVIASGRPVETKTTGIVGPNYGKWGDALTDQVPDYYLAQVHAQLLVTGASIGYLFALIAGRGVVRFEIERDDNLCEWIGNYCDQWWSHHVVGDIAPEYRNPSLDVVKRLRKEEGKRIELDEDIEELCLRWQEASALRLAAEKKEKSLQARILLALNDATEASLPGGASLLSKEYSVEAQHREAYTYRRLFFNK